MKPFILAIISLCLTVGAVAINSVITHRTCERLQNSVENAPEVTGSDLNEQNDYFEAVEKEWDKSKTLISLSVNHGTVEAIDGYVAAIMGACRVGDLGQYEVCKEKMAAALENLCGLATVNLENII
ncbi:MAG: DUF4363 family protein [Clostridia bacterium]|nr:DUF4363 family protein [Clostridia bacterium]